MLENIRVFEKQIPISEIICTKNKHPLIFYADNPVHWHRYHIYPYIFHGSVFTPLTTDNLNENDFRITQQLFDLKQEIYSNSTDILHEIYNSEWYSYDNNLVRQLILDGTKRVIADTGCVKTKERVVKLNHRWYMKENRRDEFIRSRKIMNFTHQAHIKQQWLVSLDHADIMYATRAKSNIMWKDNFKSDSEFFNEDNGWFYTNKIKFENNFEGYGLVWYNKDKLTKQQALESISR